MKKIFFTLLSLLLFSAVAQAATDYGFSVAGTTVTSDNCNNIVNNYITSGTVSYNPSNNTLFMNNVTINMTGSYNRVINNLENSDLTVMFRGTCNLTARDASVIRIRKSTTLWAPQATDVVNITGVNDVGIWMATTNDFDLTIQGPGTFNIKSTAKPAIEDEDNYQAVPLTLDLPHEVVMDNVNAVLSSGQDNVVRRFYFTFKAGSSVRFKATNIASKSVITQTSFVYQGNETILEPYGAYSSGETVYDSNGNRVIYQDVYVSDDYVAIINATNFPDANFRNYLLGLYPKGYITQTDVNNRTTMDVSGKSISNLQGIKYFTALKELRCYNNPMTSLDVSGLTALTYLDCAPTDSYTGTKLTSLNVSGCTNLETLLCYNTNISSLSVSNCTNLKKLDCHNCTRLTSLTVINKSSLNTLNCSNCTALTSLTCCNNALTTLNVTGCTALNTLKCYQNANLTAITGLADCKAITYLDCEDCQITSLPGINSMTNIATLLARNNKLTSLEVTYKSKLTNLRVNGNTTLTALHCFNNDLTTLNVTGCTALSTLNCYSNANLASITGLADCKAITYLHCEDCKITDLPGLNNMTQIQRLNASNNKLTSITLTNKASLIQVSLQNNPQMTTADIYNNSALSSLDIRNCTALTNLACYRNALTTLNVTACTALKDLRCYENSNLATITGLADCKAITYLDCEDCQISDLSAVQSMNNIQSIFARNNKLTKLTVTGKSNLANLRVNGNTLLTELYCYNNGLTSLEVANCSAMTYLDCDGNNLTSLSVNGCTSLATLGIYRNRISGSGMTTLVNSLPTRSSGSKGNLYAITNNNEGNSMTAAQITTARNKYWLPKQFNGSTWVEMTASVRGDVNGDGSVNISDVTALINMLTVSGSVSAPGADCNQDGSVNISDVTVLINYVLSGSW